MSKYILGIIAIACLQIAFTAYNRIDLAFETAQLSSGSPVIDHGLGPIDLPEIDEFPINSITKGKLIRRVRKMNVEHAVTKPRKTDRFVPRFVARREQVKPRKRIEYTTVKASDRSALHVAESTPGKKRRSIFAKTLPVIKKPYDWAKSLVAILR